VCTGTHKVHTSIYWSVSNTYKYILRTCWHILVCNKYILVCTCLYQLHTGTSSVHVRTNLHVPDWHILSTHLESCTPGTRQYKMVCTGTSQYVPYSIQGCTKNLKMVHTSTYQHRKFLWQYILVCTGMYCLVPAQYKVVQGGTRWYKVVQTTIYGGTWRYKAVRESFKSYRLVRTGMY
jgi:hypothetical protein